MQEQQLEPEAEVSNWLKLRQGLRKTPLEMSAGTREHSFKIRLKIPRSLLQESSCEWKGTANLPDSARPNRAKHWPCLICSVQCFNGENVRTYKSFYAFIPQLCLLIDHMKSWIPSCKTAPPLGLLRTWCFSEGILCLLVTQDIPIFLKMWFQSMFFASRRLQVSKKKMKGTWINLYKNMHDHRLIFWKKSFRWINFLPSAT